MKLLNQQIKKISISMLVLTLISGMFPTTNVWANTFIGQLNGLSNYVVELSADPPSSAKPSTFGSREDDGRVWADKSVSVNGNQFDVSLSVLAQEYIRTKTTEVKSQAAADVAMVLDMSGSMTADRITKMKDAVNKAIDTIMAANPRNRIGIYYYGLATGNTSGQPNTGTLFELASYSTSQTGTGSSSDRYIKSSGQTITRNKDITKKNLINTNEVLTTSTTISTSGGTATQFGLYTAINALKEGIQNYTDPNDLDKERVPYVLLLTDGEANRAYPDWYTNPPSGTEKIGVGQNNANGTAEIAALTILSAAKLKDELKTAYSAHSGGKDVVWFNVAFGLTEDNNLSTALLKPETIAGGTSGSWKEVKEQLDSFTTNAHTDYKKYGVNGTPGYSYASDYIYFIDSTNLSKVDQAISDLAALVESATKETIIPFEQKDALGEPLDLVITDVLGTDMELKGVPRMGTLEGELKTESGTVKTYKFTGKKTTVEYNSSNGELKWIISPSEVPLIMFSDRDNPTQGNYSNATTVQPQKLTFTVGAKGTYTSSTLFSNKYINTATAFMNFIPNNDNPYYYKDIYLDQDTKKIISTPKNIDFGEISGFKSKDINNVTGTATNIYENAWQSGGVFLTKLGNNGKLTPKLKIEISPTSTLVAAGEKITYNITVTNLTTTDISNVVVNNTLPNNVSFETNSIKQGGVTQASATFPYTISSVPASSEVKLSFEAKVPSGATAGTEYIDSVSITKVGATTLSTAASATAEKVTVASTFTPNVTVKLDGATYSNQTVELWKDSTKKYTLTESNGKYSYSNITGGTYTIYVNNTNTGVSISNADSNKEINFYSVSFYDGTQIYTTPSAQKVLSGGKAVEPTSPTKAGYTFDKWVTVNNGSTQFDFATVTITQKTNVYAKWIANTNTAYKVNHHQETVAGNGSYATPTVENKSGTTGGTTNAEAKTYNGFTAQSFQQKTIEADGSTVIDIYYNRNLYTINYSYNSTKGTLSEDSITVTKAVYGAMPQVPTITAKPGYEFKGWSPTVKNATSDANYTAQFDLIEYKITYNLNNGSVAVANPIKYDVESTSFTLNNPTRQGYTFSGWTGTDLSDASSSVKVEKGSTGDRNYTATWTANDYTVTLNDNGGSGGSGTVSATYDEPMPTATKPTRAGYTFIGYFDKVSDGTKYYNANMSSAKDWDQNSSSVTLYALWTELSHVTLNYVPNQATYGTVSLSSETLNPKTGTAKGSKATANSGYRFVNWKNANGDSVSTTETFIPEKSSGSYAAATYTATFEIITYDITYNLLDGTVALANKTSYTVEDNEFTLTNPTKFGYYFDGWTGTGLTSPTKTVKIPKSSTGNRSYTATWKKVDLTDDHIVMGTVIDENIPANKVAGATVEIVKGNTQYGDTATTDAAGNFTIYNVPDGIYNLIITKGEQKAIIEITISGENQIVNLGSVIFPYKASSELKLLGSKTPAIVIDNLHPEAVDSLENEYNNTGFVKVEMRIERIDQTSKDSTQVDAMSKISTRASSDGLYIGMYLDMNVEKYYRITENINWNSQGLISRTNGLIKVTIPIPKELQGKPQYKVYRYHANEVDLIQSTANGDGEYLVLDQSNWTLTLYVRNFSVYAIAFTPTAEFATNLTVTFKKEGDEGKVVSTQQDSSFGGLLTKPADPVKAGFNFVGWYKMDGDEWDFNNDRVYTQFTLTAKWVPALDKLNHFAYMQGYPDKTFGSQKNMTRAEVTVMFARLLVQKMDVGKSYPSKFKDVDSSKWYANAIGYMEQYGIITGYSDGTFRPNVTITRAEFAAVASRFDKLITGAPVSFTDVKRDYWARDYISFAATKGWIKGYPDNTFGPAKNITRAEVVSLVNRMLERYSDSSYVDKNKDKINQYVDLTNKHWAYNDIMEATNSHDYDKNSNSEIWSIHTK